HRRVSAHNAERTFSKLKERNKAVNETYVSGLNYNQLLQKHASLNQCASKEIESHLIPWYSVVSEYEESLKNLYDFIQKSGLNNEWKHLPFAFVDANDAAKQVEGEKYLEKQLQLLNNSIGDIIQELIKLGVWEEDLLVLGNLEKVLNWCKGVKTYANQGLIKLFNKSSTLFETYERYRVDFQRKQKTLERRSQRIDELEDIPPLHQVDSALNLLEKGGRRNKRKVKAFIERYFKLGDEPFSEDYETFLKHLKEEAQAQENFLQVQEKLRSKLGIERPEEFFTSFELVNDLTERTALQIPGFYESLFEKRFPDKIVLALLSAFEDWTAFFSAARFINTNYRSLTLVELAESTKSLLAFGNFQLVVNCLKQFNQFHFEIRNALLHTELSPLELVKASLEKELVEIRSRNPIIDNTLGQVESISSQFVEDYSTWLESNALLILDNQRRRFQEIEQLMTTPANQLSEDEKAYKWLLRKGKKLIEHELGKKKRFKLLNELAEQDSYHYLKSAFPVWLMSPTTVSAALKPEMEAFDVVIFDEASQLKTEWVVPCLYRAKQAVVIGDTQQLPPTVFFQSRITDDRLPEVLLENKSILQLAKTSYKSLNLSWHYRSENELLVAVSNSLIYRHQLKVFPSKKASIQPFRFTENTRHSYSQGANKAEAELVISTIMQLLVEEKQYSVAVIAFSTAQQQAIETELSKQLDNDKAFADAYENAQEYFEDHVYSGLIIQNLESIQGEERDYVIVSTAYGYDANGNFTQHFGPINQEGGEKRLNVVFTRAKKQTHIISSLNPEMITNLHSDGNLFLKLVLELAIAMQNNNLS
ncbi:MAG: DNA2/NAM7 family helicase, partial [Bacteroidetes bacterium]|nr:DNA2/NAM7 family helicase [Bacteroidota bacterium]